MKSVETKLVANAAFVLGVAIIMVKDTLVSRDTVEKKSKKERNSSTVIPRMQTVAQFVAQIAAQFVTKSLMMTTTWSTTNVLKYIARYMQNNGVSDAASNCNCGAKSFSIMMSRRLAGASSWPYTYASFHFN